MAKRIFSMLFLTFLGLGFLSCPSTTGSSASDAAAEIQVFAGSTLILSGAAYDFGSVQLGASQTAVFTVKNIGTTAQYLAPSDSIVITGTGKDDFSYVLQTTTAIPAGGTGGFTLTYTPGAVGLKTAALAVKTAEMKEALSFTLTGTGLPGTGLLVKQGAVPIASGTGTFDFGSVDYGGSSSALQFTLSNTSGISFALTGGSPVALSGTGASSFQVTAQPASTTLAAGGSETFSVRFNPDSEGSKTAVVSIQNDSATNPYTFTITGSALSLRLQDYNSAAINPGAALAYGNYIFDSGETRLDLNFTIVNFGTADLTLTDAGNPVHLDFTGLHTGAYEITSPPSTVIVPGSSANFTLRYNNPQYTSAGIKTVTVSIPSSALPSPYTFTFSVNNASLPSIQAEYDTDDSDGSVYTYASYANDSSNIYIRNLTRRFRVSNSGWGELKISSFTSLPSPWVLSFPDGTPVYPITVDETPFLFELRYAYSGTPDSSRAFNIDSNDPDDSTFIINLEGNS